VPNLPIPALCPHDNYFSDGLRIGDEAKVAARTARMASTDTMIAVPSAIANVAAPPPEHSLRERKHLAAAHGGDRSRWHHRAAWSC